MALPHIIESQKILIDTNSVQLGKDLQKKFSEILGSSLFQNELEELFNGIAGGEDWVYFNKLELNVGNLSSEVSEGEIKSRILKSLTRSISDAGINTYSTAQKETSPKKESLQPQRTSVLEKLKEAWLMFLREQRLPQIFHSQVQSAVQFIFFSEQILKKEDSTFEVWFVEIARKISIEKLMRLPFSFWKEVLIRLVKIPEKGNERTMYKSIDRFIKVFEKVEKRGESINRIAKEKLIEFYLNRKTPQPNVKEMRAFLRELELLTETNQISTTDLIKTVTPVFKGVSEWKTENEEESKSPFITNAGMVLLFAFLPEVFKRLGYLTKDKIVKPNRALQFLRFLESGEEQFAPHQNNLYKIVCGLPENFIEEAGLPLNKKEKKEADNLLKSVIEHWGALKNTTPNGLREAFLQRIGKLENRGFDYHLKVEQKAQDILLSKISWSFAVVKLPWMTYFLHVDW